MGSGESSNGRDFEVMVARLLEQHQIGFLSQWVPGWLGPVGEMIRVDFKLHGLSEWPAGLCVECKMQDGPGSSWEKIAYAIDSIKTCYKLPSLLIIDGTAGEAKKALRYARDRKGNSLQCVFTFMEFRAFCRELSGGTSKVKLASEYDPDQLNLFDS